MPRIFALVVLLSIWAVPARAVEHMSVGAGYRYMGYPDFLVDLAFDDHQPVMAHGIVLEYNFGSWRSHWTAGLTGAWMAIPDGYWRAAGAGPGTAVWAEFPLGYIGAYFGHSWKLELTRNLFFAPTLGLGIGYLLGDIYATEVIPGCTGDVVNCGHWNEVTRGTVEFTTRFIPILVAEASLAYQFKDFLVSLDVGLMDFISIGLSVEWSFKGTP